MEFIKKLYREEEAQGLTEYALIIAAIVFVLYIAIDLGGFGAAIQGVFTRVSTALAALGT